MIRFEEGNVLDAPVDALVNTVNTVGVMGKGIALMFKERFPENFEAYARACKAGEVQLGQMYVVPRDTIDPPHWIVNFPTKDHWRSRTRVAWIEQGLADLRQTIRDLEIESIALPPLGCGNGGLSWATVRPLIEEYLGDFSNVEIQVYQPTAAYQNVRKPSGVKELTVPRALMVAAIQAYWRVGLDCTNLEAQKLAWFLDRAIAGHGLDDVLKLDWQADKFGPYADNLRHLLDRLDGSYLSADKRLSDASPYDGIGVRADNARHAELFMTRADAKPYKRALEDVQRVIAGFESPLGMELLATLDWLAQAGYPLDVASMREGIDAWPAGRDAAQRKQAMFTDHMLGVAIDHLAHWEQPAGTERTSVGG